MRRVVAFLVVVVVAGACGLGEAMADYGEPVELGPSDLVGMWEGGQRSRLVVFDEDGSFVATGLPPGPVRAPNGADAWGTWSIKPPIKEGTSTGVELSIDGVAGRRDQILYQLGLSPSRQDNGQIWLIEWGFEVAWERCELMCFSATILTAVAARARMEQAQPATSD